MRMNTFEVRKHDIEIQVVLVLRSRGVLDDCSGDGILVIAAELAAASRALLISHEANLPPV